MIGRRIRDLQRAAQRPDTAVEISQRIADRHAREEIHQLMRRKFQPLTPDNITAALDWQDQALRELDRTVPR